MQRREGGTAPERMSVTDQGQITPTMKEVASLAGVALSSVSRVLNEHPDVSPAMRLRVLRAVAELGYEPDLLASSLRRGSSRTLGFIVSDIVNPLFADIFTGAEQRLRERGYSVLLAQSEGDPARDVESARLLRRRRVDGLILSLADETSPETAAELQRLDLPVVLLDREVAGLEHVCAVLADHRTGVRRATEYLLNLGYQRIALISGAPTTRPPRERATGFRDAFVRNGVPVPEDLVRLGSFSTEYGARSVEELLALPDPPDAIVAGGNLILVGVIRTLRRAGLRVGDDMALVTCDGVPLAEFYSPAITVVNRDTTEMGVLAARLMLEQLEVQDGQQRRPRTETVPTELIVRESTPPRRQRSVRTR